MRLLFHLFAGASMLLVIASIVMWVRSHRAMDRAFQIGGHVQQTLTSLDGRVQFQRRTGFARGESAWHVDSHRNAGPWIIDTLAARPWYQRLGFDFVHRNLPAGPQGATDLIIMVPYWFLAALFAAMPVIFVVQHIHHASRNRAGYCSSCGYDLRATPDRCPECGAAVTSRRQIAP